MNNLPHRQKVVLQEIDDQIIALEAESLKNGQAVNTLIRIGQDVAKLEIAKTIIENYNWKII